MILVIRTAMLGLVLAGGVLADEMRNVHGSVVDETGTPVAAADVGFYWWANGPFIDPSGKPYDFGTDEGRRAHSANLAMMFPLGDIERPTKTGPDGRFSMSMPGDRHHLLAMDHSRKRGSLVILPKAKGAADVQIRLDPLVRVKGLIEGPGANEHPEWANVLLWLIDDPTRPLDLTVLAPCESFDGRFEMSLPPGRYVLDAYTIRDNDKAQITPAREILIKGEVSELDLGVLRVSPYMPLVQGRIEKAKAAGTWGDHTKHYGEEPPLWYTIDARGVPQDVQISDFKGKWVLVYFWGLACYPCLKQGIPDLIKFYEEHKAQRDRFEILAFCIDVEGELKSIAELDQRLQPIVEHIWGKPMPFPVLLANGFKTWERYGLPAFGVHVLIDPQGNLVEWDEKVLAEKLKER